MMFFGVEEVDKRVAAACLDVELLVVSTAFKFVLA
jgi:hypothetical protein